MNDGTAVKGFLTVLNSSIIWLFGAWNAVLGILGAVIVCDYISGVMCAAKNKQLNSYTGWKGLLKKFATILVVLVAHQLDIAFGNEQDIIRNITALFYVSNELLSIFENVGNLGVPLPEVLKNACVQIKNKTQGTAEPFDEDKKITK